jgi:hypothetical protein
MSLVEGGLDSLDWTALIFAAKSGKVEAIFLAFSRTLRMSAVGQPG